MKSESNPSTASSSATARSTQHQRLHARSLMQQLELDTRRFTLFHNRIWVSAALSAPPLGVDLDAVLCDLAKVQMRALIDALRRELSE